MKSKTSLISKIDKRRLGIAMAVSALIVLVPTVLLWSGQLDGLFSALLMPGAILSLPFNVAAAFIAQALAGTEEGLFQLYIWFVIPLNYAANVLFYGVILYWLQTYFRKTEEKT